MFSQTKVNKIHIALISTLAVLKHKMIAIPMVIFVLLNYKSATFYSNKYHSEVVIYERGSHRSMRPSYDTRDKILISPDENVLHRAMKDLG